MAKVEVITRESIETARNSFEAAKQALEDFQAGKDVEISAAISDAEAATATANTSADNADSKASLANNAAALAESSSEQALFAAGVEEEFISTTVDTLPDSTSAVEGSRGAYPKTEGHWQMVEWDATGSQWIETGIPFVSYAGLKVENVTGLTSRRGLISGQTVEMLGYYNPGDGGGGTLYWDANSEEVDNGGTVFEVPGVAVGRWKRDVSGAIDVRKFGAKGDKINDDTTAIQKANNIGPCWIPAGEFLISSISAANNILGFGEIHIATDSGNAITLANFTTIHGPTIKYEGQSASPRNIVYSEADFVTLNDAKIFVTNSTLSNKANAVSFVKSRYFTVSKCVINGPYIDSPAYLSAGDLGSGIVIRNSRGSIIGTDSSGFLDGLKVSLDTSDEETESYVTVSSSHFRNNARDGIDAYIMSGGFLSIKGCHLTGNQDLIADFKTSGDVDDTLEDSYDVIFEGNQCYDNNIERSGISLADNDRVKIDNNVITDCRFGISVLRGAATITNNEIRRTQLYGIQFINTIQGKNQASKNTIVDTGLNGGTVADSAAIVLSDSENATVESNTILVKDSLSMVAVRFEGTSVKNIVRFNKANRNGVIVSGITDWTTNYIYGNTGLVQDEEGDFRYSNEGKRLQIYAGGEWRNHLTEGTDYFEFSDELVDDEFVKITDLDRAGFGKVIVGDNEEHADIWFNSDGTNITLYNNTANFSSGNNDTDFVIYVANGELRLRNRLGSPKQVKSIIFLQS